MPRSPFFSIITPLLNGYHYIQGYVETLRSQTCSDWEAIIIDDGSSDGSIDELRKIISRDPRFTILFNDKPKKIKSPYQARNIGLEHASGAYVCFLDIDDRWLSFKLQLQKEEILSKPSIDLLFSPYYRVSSLSCHIAKVRSLLPFLHPKMWISIANPVPMLTSCVRRELLDNIRFKPIYHEDYVFWYEIFRHTESINVSCGIQPLAIYLVSSSSLSSNKLKASLWNWKCYRSFGYSLPITFFACFARGVIQLFIIFSDNFVNPVELTSNSFNLPSS